MMRGFLVGYNTTMAIEIITLSPSDWSRYRDLRLKSLQTDPQAFADTYEFADQQTESYWRGHLERADQAQGSWMLFAEDQGQLVGCMSAVIFEDDKIPTIVGVYVAPEARGQGLGKRLLTSLLQRLKKASVTGVKLSVNVEQLTALKLYQSLGFIVKGHEHKKMGDDQLHLEYLMEMSL